jgi:hypothetical protein
LPGDFQIFNFSLLHSWYLAEPVAATLCDRFRSPLVIIRMITKPTAAAKVSELTAVTRVMIFICWHDTHAAIALNAFQQYRLTMLERMYGIRFVSDGKEDSAYKIQALVRRFDEKASQA